MWWITAGLAAVLVGVTAGAESLKNGDFEAESLEPWQVFQSEGATARSELVGQPRVLSLRGEGPAKSFVGIFQTVPEIRPGERYRFTILTKVVEAGKGRGQISVEWFDAEQRELARAWGPTWPLDETDRVWQEQSMRATAPAEAVAARVVVTLFIGDEPGATGVVQLDEATFSGP